MNGLRTSLATASLLALLAHGAAQATTSITQPSMSLRQLLQAAPSAALPQLTSVPTTTPPVRRPPMQMARLRLLVSKVLTPPLH